VPSGAWIVDEWKLSAPRLSVAQRGVQDGYSSTAPQQFIAIGRIENGGGIFAPGELTGEQHRQVRAATDTLNRKH
jgi:hypothetical protein